MHCALAISPLLFKRLKLAVLVAVDGFEGVSKVGHDLFLDGQLLAQAPVVSLELLDVAHHAHCTHHGSKQEAKRPPAAPSTLSLAMLTATQQRQVVVNPMYMSQ